MKGLKFWMIAPIAAAANVAGRLCRVAVEFDLGRVWQGQSGERAGERMGYLHLVAPGDVTEAAAGKLMGACASGKLTDVQPQLSVRDFLGIVQSYDADANGVCL